MFYCVLNIHPFIQKAYFEYILGPSEEQDTEDAYSS